MRAGYFGINGRIEIAVTADGTVLNGLWVTEYDEATDRVRFPGTPGYSQPSDWLDRIEDAEAVAEWEKRCDYRIGDL